MNVLIIEDHPFFAANLGRAVAVTFPYARIIQEPSLEKAVNIIRGDDDIHLIVSDLTLIDSEPHNTFDRMSRYVPPRSYLVFISGLEVSSLVVSKILAAGYLFVRKTEEPQKFVEALKSLFSFPDHSRVTNQYQSQIAVGRNKPLTLKQVEMIELLIKGMTLKEIAHFLGKSPATVNMQLRDAFKRLAAPSRASAIVNYLAAKEFSNAACSADNDLKIDGLEFEV